MHHKPGDVTNVLVATKIMGWEWIDYKYYDGSTRKLLWHPCLGEPQGDDFNQSIAEDIKDGEYVRITVPRLVPWTLPEYSEKIELAWQVVEQITTPGLYPLFGGKYSTVTLFRWWWREYQLWSYSASEAAGLICSAALVIMEEGQVEPWS